MTHYDELRSQYGNSSPEEKLSLIRYAYKRYIPTIQSIANILKETGERAAYGIPDDFVKWCEAITKSADDFSEVIEALLDTDDYNRETRKIDDEKRDTESEERHWKYVQGQLPELKAYTNLNEALLNGFDNPSIQQLKELESKWPSYSRTNSEFIKQYYRGIRIATHYQPGYIIRLFETIDQRNLTARQHEGVTSSLNEAYIILRSWMLDRATIENVISEHLWLKEVTF
jgi:hypothetical protein